MNTHYIPCLLLRHFGEKEKANVYDFKTQQFSTEKIKNIFVEEDLYDEQLEKAFATRMEGPFGDLLNNKLLKGDVIEINRAENLLIRKFFMLHFLRSTLVNDSWEEMVKRMHLENHPSAIRMKYWMDHGGILGETLKSIIPTSQNFVQNLKLALEIEDVRAFAEQDLLSAENPALVGVAQSAVAMSYTIWDSTECGQEFILSQVPGVSESDMFGFGEKAYVIEALCEKIKEEPLHTELVTRLYGSMAYSENYSIYPISATRVLIGFSPFFRLFFPIRDNWQSYEQREQPILFSPVLDEKEFQRHFYYPIRMELFENCDNYKNQKYRYRVKQLRTTEVHQLNSLMLNMEPEKFVFHDYNRIRDSLWFYDHVAQFATGKKHGFHMWC